MGLIEHRFDDNIITDDHRSRAQLGARVLDLAHGVRAGVLRHRDDGGVGVPV